jgi:hypothetical protein
MNGHQIQLCGANECRRIAGHAGGHDPHPTEAWSFFHERDKNKLAKAGFATPRGGAKGAYQNHVTRNNRVIIPYERLADVNLELYADGYVIRLLPEQYFSAAGQPRQVFLAEGSPVVVGHNAFVLYRTHDSFVSFPPLADWQPRSLLRDGQVVGTRRGVVTDTGHYVLRLSRIGANHKRHEGPPQGIFATEYADETTNFLSKCVLAWLTIQAAGSPYTLNQSTHLRAILRQNNLDDVNYYEMRGVMRHALCCCPLCTRFIRYEELHELITFGGDDAPANASHQSEGATRSTVANLFHITPLVYHSLTHVPSNVAWGHAICNTHLGQRRCFSLPELIAMDRKVGIIREEGVETFGWISDDWQMIRSPNGAVWIQLNGDVEEGPPSEPVFDEAAEGPIVGG